MSTCPDDSGGVSKTTRPTWPQPLVGVKIIDFSLLLPGPYCTHLLTEMGATTIKVEPPSGDPVRSMSPKAFGFYNRGKQSVCVDAKRPEVREFLLRLTDDADVIVEGFRPGVMDTLGLGFDTVRARNPHLIYVSISGYGQDGVYAQRPGHDVNIIAAAGYFATTLDLDDHTMQRPRLRIADYFVGMLSAFSIAAMLRTPRTERRAVYVDASMFDAMAYVTLPGILTATPELAADPTLRADALADVAVYETSDGRAITIGTLEDKFWPPLVTALRDRFPEIADPLWTTRRGRTEDKRRLAIVLREVFGKLTLNEIKALLPTDTICWAPVLRGTELLADQHVIDRQLIADTPHGKQPTSPVAFDGVRAPADRAAPALGEHTAAIAAALGIKGFTTANK